MRVRDVLTAKGSSAVFTISSDATIEQLLDSLAEHNVGALIVSSDGQTLTGIVSERDIVRKLLGVQSPRSVLVNQIMSTDVQVASPEESFGALMAAMTEHRVRHIPIIEEEQIVGLVSIGDAVKFRMDQLEFERDQLTNYVSG
mgnify:FL=1